MRLYLYQLKNLLKSYDIMFWTMAFPIVLGTLFFVSFGSAKSDSVFKEIPVGVIYEEENETFDSVINGTDLFKTQELSKTEATKKLNDDKIVAFIEVKGEEVKMRVKTSSIKATIVETFLNEYLSTVDTVETIAKEHPEKLQQLIDDMSQDSEKAAKGSITVKEATVNQKKYSPFTNYFYALIAMTCLFGSMFTQKSIEELQADQSPLGARRNIAPTNKITLLMIDIVAAWTIQFLEMLITIGYLAGLLGIDFGNNVGYMILMSFVGSYVSSSLGMFIGTVVKGDSNKKSGVITSVCLTLCFMAGLMYGDMINIIEKGCPILNDINPAALIVNAFHSLAIYDTSQQYFKNLLVLLVMGVVMNAISVMIVRRKKYASI